MKKCIWCGKKHNEEYNRYFCSEKCEKYYDKSWEMTTRVDDEIMCPYCGNVESDDLWEYGYYNEGYYIHECVECGKKFELSISVTTTYKAEPLKEVVEKLVNEENEVKV
jgi:NAD-dependent SIR2 family protein deacetylase